MGQITIPGSLITSIEEIKDNNEQVQEFLQFIVRGTFIQTTRLIHGLLQSIGKEMDYHVIYKMFRQMIDEHESVYNAVAELPEMYISPDIKN